MSQLKCEIVQDLLPLYCDEVVNTVTREAVAEHLENCEACCIEYRLLKTDLPDQAEGAAPTGKFSAFAKTLKKKRVAIAVISALLSCFLLFCALGVLNQVPLVPIPEEDLPVYQVYRYEVGGEKFFFVLYANPWYTGSSSGTFDFLEDETGALTLVMNWRTTVFSEKFQNKFTEEIFRTDAEYKGRAFSTFRFNDKIVWTEAENADDPIPEYVYALHDWQTHGKGCTVDVSQNYIGIEYEDGRVVKWDLDGNLLFDSAA